MGSLPSRIMGNPTFFTSEKLSIYKPIWHIAINHKYANYN